MEILVSLFLIAIQIGIIYFLVQVFLSEDFITRKMSNKFLIDFIRYGLLFIIGGLVAGMILFFYLSFGVDRETYGVIGIIASAIFIFWLERKDYRENQSNSNDVSRKPSDRTLLYSASGLVFLPVILTIFLN